MSKKIKKLKKRKLSKVSTEIQEKFNTAAHLSQTGLLGQAHRLLGEIIEKNPSHLDSYKLLVDTALQTGQANIALSILKKAVAQNPENSVCRGYLADLLSQMGLYSEAIPHYEKEIALSRRKNPPGFDLLFLNTAIAYQNSGKPLKAIEKFKGAISENRKNKEAYYLLASTYQAIGDTGNSEKYTRKCLDIDPFHPKCLYILSTLNTSFFSKTLTSDLIKKVEAKETKVEDKIFLSFTLYTIFETSHDFDNAFKFLKIGNDLKKETNPYNFDKQAEYFRYARKVFTEFLELEKQQPPSEFTPIFIVGMPRSGTTLVEQIIASHRGVTAGGEITAMGKIAKMIIYEIYSSPNPDTNLLINPDNLKNFQKIYFDEVSKFFTDNVKFTTDKMPQNFFFLGLIKSIFPNAKIIHCKRNPISTTFSCYKTLFTVQGQEFSNDLYDLVKFYKLYQDHIFYWQKLIPDSILDVQYEDIIDDQESETRRILDFCGLDWDDSCLNFHETERTVNTASVMQVRKPIYKSSLALWKKYEKHLGPLMELAEIPK